MKTILIADDDEDIRRVISMQLQRFPYRILEASTGDEILDLARRHCPDVILMDWHMPGIEGKLLLQALRREPALRMVPIIVMTGEDEVAREAEQEGAFRSFVKPFVPRDLVHSLQAAMSESVQVKFRQTGF